jgi:hypothetical protein
MLHLVEEAESSILEGLVDWHSQVQDDINMNRNPPIPS